MSRKITTTTAASGGCGCLTLICIAMAAIGAFCWPYTLNTWLVFLGKQPVIEWWHGVILGFIPYLGMITIPAAAVTWILMLFLAGA